MSGFHYTEFSKTGSILLNAEEKEKLFGYIDRLKAENEKLRELVRDMKAVIWAYDEYTSDDDCPPALPLFEDRLHELGIGVDA